MNDQEIADQTKSIIKAHEDEGLGVLVARGLSLLIKPAPHERDALRPLREAVSTLLWTKADDIALISKVEERRTRHSEAVEKGAG